MTRRPTRERERRRQRIAQQRLEDDAGRGQRRADEDRRRGRAAAAPEENLRVDVVAPRIERSNARASEIGVLPPSAPDHDRDRKAANAATTVTIRRRMLIYLRKALTKEDRDIRPPREYASARQVGQGPRSYGRFRC